MNQETKNLIDFIKNKESNVERLGTLKYWECLNTLCDEVEKQDLYDTLENFCDYIDALFDIPDINELVDVLQTRDYFLLYGLLFKLLYSHLTEYETQVRLKSIQTNDVDSQNTIIDYLSMRFHIQKEDKDDN